MGRAGSPPHALDEAGVHRPWACSDPGRRRPARRLRRRCALILCAAGLWVQGWGGAVDGTGPSERAPVGLRKQLLVDDFVVASSSGVRRELGRVEKAQGGRPIFPEGRFYGTVLRDRGLFKLWYRKPGTLGYGYAVSRDGLAFQHRADVEGIPFAGDYSLAVEPDRGNGRRRFLAAYDAVGMAAGLAQSRDGIHWTPFLEGRPVTSRAADSYNQVLWDPEAGIHRLFTRTDFGAQGGSGEVRGTRSMINPDLDRQPGDWRMLSEWRFDREGKEEDRRRQVYALTCWIHEGVKFGLVTVYEYPGDLREGTETDPLRRHERDIMNCYLATSRDAASWDLSWVYAGAPLIPRGEPGAFDKDLILPASTVVTHADRHWIYYSGANERHGTEAVRLDRAHAIGLATVPLDRFIGLRAGATEGTVVTRPFRLDGSRLIVNTDAHEGRVSVEVLTEAGEPIAGYSGSEAPVGVGIDEIRWRPRWRRSQDLSSHRGRVVRLRFHLRDAAVYSFQIRK